MSSNHACISSYMVPIIRPSHVSIRTLSGISVFRRFVTKENDTNSVWIYGGEYDQALWATFSHRHRDTTHTGNFRSSNFDRLCLFGHCRSQLSMHRRHGLLSFDSHLGLFHHSACTLV